MIADVRSATGAGAQGAAAPLRPGGEMGKDEFLRMLVAQLRNQDPMNPMNGDDMAAQLAQFSSLEQLTNISAQLEAQAALQSDIVGSIGDTTAMNTIGRTVLAVGDQVEVSGDGGGSVHFEVGDQGGTATLRILDESGREVGSRPLGFVAAGRHEVDLGSAVHGLDSGSYHYAIDIADSAGDPVPVQPFIRARIDGVRYGPNGPVLTAGDVRIAFGTILQITEEG